jgi:DNA-directed RNA polymerase specialized sigma24 family protein
MEIMAGGHTGLACGRCVGDKNEAVRPSLDRRLFRLPGILKRFNLPGSPSFPETRWSLVLGAGGLDDATREASLQRLFLRSRGWSQPDAEDLTQDFIAHLIAHQTFARADSRLGRFRAFLIGSLKLYLHDVRDRTRALKRGGNRRFVNLDWCSQNDPFAFQDFASLPPETVFDQGWALTLLTRAMSRLKEEYAARGQDVLVAELAGYLTAQSATPTYEVSAARIGISLPALKSAILRLRRRYAEIVRDEVAHTVSAPHEVDLELEHLFAVLGSRGQSALQPG